MYLLKKNNIEKEVDSEIICNQLINDGFKLVENGFVEYKAEFTMQDETEEKINISDMTLEELKAIAKEKGIEKYSSMKKADLVEIIEKLG